MNIPPQPGTDWSFDAPPGWPVDASWQPPEDWNGPESDWPAPPPYWTWWTKQSGAASPPTSSSPVGDIRQNSYATWATRLAGALIDGALVYVLPWIVSLIVTSFTDVIGRTFSVPLDYTVLAMLSIRLPALILVVGTPGLVFLFIAQILMEGKTGQSVGKRLVRIRIVSIHTGQPIGIATAFARRAYRFVNVLPLGAGFLWPLWDKNRQTLADKLVDTVVVKS